MINQVESKLIDLEVKMAWLCFSLRDLLTGPDLGNSKRAIHYGQ